jgi:hypothetical protein
MTKRKRKADEMVNSSFIYCMLFSILIHDHFISELSKAVPKISKRARELDTDMYPMDLAFDAKTADD